MLTPDKDDISVVDMLNLREQGASNREIATKLGCSYYEVLKRIGKRPKKVFIADFDIPEDISKIPPYSRQPVPIPALAKACDAKAELAKKEHSFLEEIAVHLSGAVANYEIIKGSAVLITRNGHALPQFTLDEICSLINELHEVARRLES